MVERIRWVFFCLFAGEVTNGVRILVAQESFFRQELVETRLSTRARRHSGWRVDAFFVQPLKLFNTCVQTCDQRFPSTTEGGNAWVRKETRKNNVTHAMP